jgi:hypothetical protein
MNAEKYPLGVLYKAERPAYHEQVGSLQKGKTLLERERFSNFDILINEFV